MNFFDIFFRGIGFKQYNQNGTFMYACPPSEWFPQETTPNPPIIINPNDLPQRTNLNFLTWLKGFRDGVSSTEGKEIVQRIIDEYTKECS